MSVTSYISTKTEEFKRSLRERNELERAKARDREKERAFADLHKKQISEEREARIKARAEREAQLSAQRAKELEAKKQADLAKAQQKSQLRELEIQRREASKAHAQASAALRREKFTTFKEKVAEHPLFKPVELGGTALRSVARGGVTKFYTLSSRPSSPSPSYDVLDNSFGGQPFTADQAIYAVSVGLQTSESDAYNRLRLMKQYGYIREI